MSQQSTVDSRPLPEQSAGSSATVAAKAAAPARKAAAPSSGAPVNYVPWAIAGALALLLILVVFMARRPKTVVVMAPPVTAPPATVAPPPSTGPSAQRHLAQAIDYQRKLWCSDALEELDKALRDDDSLRADANAQRTAIACLTPKTRERAMRLLTERVGAAGRAELERAATEAPNSEVRSGAKETLDRLPQ